MNRHLMRHHDLRTRRHLASLSWGWDQGTGETPHHKQQEKAQKVYKVNSMPIIDRIKRFLFLNLLLPLILLQICQLRLLIKWLKFHSQVFQGCISICYSFFCFFAFFHSGWLFSVALITGCIVSLISYSLSISPWSPFLVAFLSYFFVTLYSLLSCIYCSNDWGISESSSFGC